MSASAEDDNEDEEEDNDDCDTTYDHQHPHTQLGFYMKHKQTLIKHCTHYVKPSSCRKGRLWPQGYGHVIFPAPPSPLSLPALTDLQRYRSRRQPCVVLPQLTPPLSAISCTDFRDGEMGGVMVRGHRLQGRLFRWEPFQSQVRGQRKAEAASQVDLLARNEVCSWGGDNWRENEIRAERKSKYINENY